MAVFGSASVSYCQAGKKHLRSFSVWHLKTAGWIKQGLLSPETLYCLNLVTLHFSQKLEDCVFISPLSSSKSPFMSIRGEFKFPRAAAVVALGLQCRITTRPTRNQELFNMATWLALWNPLCQQIKKQLFWVIWRQICCLCKPPLKAKCKTKHITVIQLAPVWLRNTDHNMYTFACLRVIVCQHVVQHLTEALIATANQNYACTASRITRRLHFHATSTCTNTPYLVSLPHLPTPHVCSSSLADHV